MIQCPACQRQILDDSCVCSYCGAAVRSATEKRPAPPPPEAGPAPPPQATPEPPTHPGDSERLTPRTMLTGRYRILGLLGKGGMGEVYRANDTRLDRDVAVKVLPGHLSQNPEALNRFEREAKTVAALSHPNILGIHDVGTEGDLSFVVMELLEGETLRQRVRGSALPWRKAVEIGAAIADGLAAAHGKGITHRDLKPENIFLTSDGVVKILDFGLARVEPGPTGVPSDGRADTPTVTLDTRPGTVLGTVNYMSPEQVRGDRIDARSDIFSFGCLLYEMVTGQRAFTGDSTPETMTAILKEELPSVVASRAEVAPEVDRLIARCVEKKPEHRIQSARDLGFALRDALMDSGPSGIAADTPAPKATRLPWLLVGMLAVALAVILTLWQASRPRGIGGEAITSLAVLPFTDAGGDPDTEYLSEEIPANIINSLSRLSDLRVIPRSTAFRHRGPDNDLTNLGRELKVAAILTGRITARGDRLSVRAELADVVNNRQLWGARYNRQVADILTIEEDIAEQISQALRLELGGKERTQLQKRHTENPEAYRAYLQGRFWWNKRTQEGFRKAIDFFDEAIRVDPGYALAYAGKADTYAIMGYYTHRPSEVAPLARKAAETAIRLDPTLAESYPPLAWVHAMYNWDWEAGEKAFCKAIELNPRYATAHHWYAVLLMALGRFDEAEREIRRALELDPGSLIINREYATTAFFRRDFDLALRRCRRAAEMDPMFTPTRAILGDIYLSLERYDEAIAEYRKLVEWEGRIARYAGALGYIYGLAGRRAEAQEELRILTELSAQGEYVPAGAFGMIHAGLGDLDSAFQWLDKACEERDNNLPFFKFAPGLDPLRSDPRFDALIARLNLPPDPPAPVVPPRPSATHAPAQIMLAVLPFTDMSPEPQEWFSDGMTGELITTLGRIEALGVISRTSVMRYKDTVTPLPQIARELNANRLVEGSVLRVGGRVRITVELIDAATDTHLWSNSYEHDERDVITLQNEVARAIATEIQIKLTPQEQNRMTSARSVDPKAYEAYLRGRHWWNKRTYEGFQRAIDFFNQAVALDRFDASALAGLSDTYVLLSFYGLALPRTVCPRAKEAAERALETDPSSAEAYTSLGSVSMFYEWDPSAAERAYKQAIRLDPNYAPARYRYATCLTAMGRFDEARREAKRAIKSDPLAAVGHQTLVWGLFFERAYDEMIQRALEALEFAPDYAWLHVLLGDAYSGKGMFDEAIASQEKGVRLSNGAFLAKAALGITYAKAGRKDEARRILDELQERARTVYVAAYPTALIYAGLGDKEMTFHWLERAFEDRDGWIFFLNVDPRCDALRDDPRFDDLLRRIGFEPTRPAGLPAAPRRGDASATPPARSDEIRLAVLPFEQMSSDPDTDYLSEEIPASIIDSLSNLSKLHVIPRSTAFRCKIDDRDTASIGRDLNATAVLTGQINARGDDLRIRAELVDVATNRQLWSQRYDRTLTDILAIERDIADRLSEALKVRLTGEDRTQLALRSTENAEAHQAYLEGRFWWNRRSREGYNKAIESFDEAIRLDPGYALAYAGKADCYCLMVLLDSSPRECIPKAREAVEQALAVDGALAEAHTSLGWIKWVYDWEWRGAESSFKRAIELNPRYATAYNWYAVFLAAIGRETEAMEQMTRAHQLDPGSLIINRDLGVIYSWTGQTDHAIEQLRKTIQMDPRFAPAHAHLGRVYVDAGRYDEAIPELEIAVDIAGHVTHGGMLGHAYAKAGRRDDALRELEKLSELSKQHEVPAHKFALICAGLDKREQAFEWLEKAYENKEFPMAILQVGQGLGSLRDDPRFDALIQRIGVPSSVPVDPEASTTPHG